MRKIVMPAVAAAVAVTVGVAALAPAAMARGPKNSTTATYSALELVVASGSDQVANWGDTVTFKVSTDAYQPHLDLVCTQGGTKVLGATTGYYDSYQWPWTQLMTLSTPAWTGGAADCTATLYYWDGRHSTVLETLNFPVAA